MDEIFALANAIQHADFTSEKQVRKLYDVLLKYLTDQLRKS